MPVKPTVQLGDPLLRTACREVAEPDLSGLRPVIEDLSDTLADWVRRTTYGRGIAAPQIGVPLRLVHLRLDEPWALVNPVITAHSDDTWEPWDACLSFSLQFFCRVRRYRWADVEWQSLDGTRHRTRAEGELGELLQHEIDHLDGIVAVDRITSIDTLCMRPEFELRHRDKSPYHQ
jgi:peptide deformylase